MPSAESTLLAEARAAADWIIAIHRELHQYPELGYQETRQRLIRKKLDELGIPYKYPLAGDRRLGHARRRRRTVRCAYGPTSTPCRSKKRPMCRSGARRRAKCTPRPIAILLCCWAPPSAVESPREATLRHREAHLPTGRRGRGGRQANVRRRRARVAEGAADFRTARLADAADRHGWFSCRHVL